MVAKNAGWRIPPIDSEGVARFLLADALDLELRSPDRRQLILTADFGEAPEAGTADGDDRLLLIGKAAAAVTKAQRSRLTIRGGRLELSAAVSLEREEPEILDTVRYFLNDEAWWRETLEASPSVTAFGFPSGAADWFSQLRF